MEISSLGKTLCGSMWSLMCTSVEEFPIGGTHYVPSDWRWEEAREGGPNAVWVGMAKWVVLHFWQTFLTSPSRHVDCMENESHVFIFFNLLGGLDGLRTLGTHTSLWWAQRSQVEHPWDKLHFFLALWHCEHAGIMIMLPKYIYQWRGTFIMVSKMW